MRFELTTPTLARLCSTPELRPLMGTSFYRVFNRRINNNPPAYFNKRPLPPAIRNRQQQRQMMWAGSSALNKACPEQKS